MTLHPSRSKLITILAHVLVWVAFGIAMFFYHPLFSGIDISYEAWVSQTVTLLLLVTAFYINVSLLVPRFLLNNKLSYYLLAIVFLVAATVLVNRTVVDALHSAHQISGARPGTADSLIKVPPPLKFNERRPIDRPTIIITALVLGIGTSITAIQKWQNDKQQREVLEKEKISSELSFLKAQINPHFFFNTLNNIYALTQVNAHEAGNAIHQLSRMMRYLLYETQQGQTMLSREIAFVNDYISLMQLRLTHAVRVNFQTPADLVDRPMAPMLLLPFVENAFKHGVSTMRHSHIDIVIVQCNGTIDITIKNSIMMDNSNGLETNSGIGLLNTRRRLHLLYPGKHTLETSRLHVDDEYIVHLTLNLS